MKKKSVVVLLTVTMVTEMTAAGAEISSLRCNR